MYSADALGARKHQHEVDRNQFKSKLTSKNQTSQHLNDSFLHGEKVSRNGG
jgi:hypothetical protein